jgi:DNA replicative helicase MCM subunit Mcm2 (Cdc46/Mcm family)
VLQEDHQLTSEGEEQAFEDVQVLLFSSQPFGPQGMRNITSGRVSQLVQISGIVTSASKQKVSTAGQLAVVRHPAQHAWRYAVAALILMCAFRSMPQHLSTR